MPATHNLETLRAAILELSLAKDWKSAVQEWSLESIEVLDHGESGRCLCGHRPIKHLCHLLNGRNRNAAIVGNVCVNHFVGEGGVFEEAAGVVPRHAAACRCL